jgi:succinate dehydrogenase flavin-adding protein (antitoxin of CptAB toxin-antitoxin module)
LIYLIFRTKNKTIEQQSEIIKQKKKEFEDIKKSNTIKLDSLSMALEEQIEDAQDLGVDYKALLDLRGQVENDKIKLQQALSLSADEFKKKLSQYENILNEKDKELAKLRGDNDKLSSQNNNLSKDYKQIQKTVIDLQKNQQKMSDQIGNYTASLQALNIEVKALNNKGVAKLIEEYRARQIVSLKIYFNFAPNAKAKVGNRAVYIRIVEPNGTVLTTGNSFETEGGNSLSYSLMQNCMFDNSPHALELSFNKGSEFKVGKYNLEIYTDGQLIGSSIFYIR